MKTINEGESEFGYGVGQIDPVKAVNPGLLYDALEVDYAEMLCNLNYTADKIRIITGENITCNASKGGEALLNYPSMAVYYEPDSPITAYFPRSATNVGFANSTYKATISNQPSLNISVTPNVLSFKSLNEKQSFIVNITGGVRQRSRVVTAWLTWSDVLHYEGGDIVDTDCLEAEETTLLGLVSWVTKTIPCPPIPVIEVSWIEGHDVRVITSDADLLYIYVVSCFVNDNEGYTHLYLKISETVVISSDEDDSIEDNDIDSEDRYFSAGGGYYNRDYDSEGRDSGDGCPYSDDDNVHEFGGYTSRRKYKVEKVFDLAKWPDIEVYDKLDNLTKNRLRNPKPLSSIGLHTLSHSKNLAPPHGRDGAQVVAINVQGDQAAFFCCGFLTYQDILLANKLNKDKHFFKECFIQGSVDFIYSNGRSLFEDIRIPNAQRQMLKVPLHRKQEEGIQPLQGLKGYNTGYKGQAPIVQVVKVTPITSQMVNAITTIVPYGVDTPIRLRNSFKLLTDEVAPI
ncbi:hypothetical protein IFM89_008985 [Coptis chinensis]|uniref:Pectinesterase n=1 Tax=Coptis chinensis TaxID=261450 RepID=A0A835HU09_9MAGN|nr:hypothetical protein IFM89_008985 [Coptis chinensis]